MTMRFTGPLRPPDPQPAAVEAFLSAVDRAMNSNTLLLTAECDPAFIHRDRTFRLLP